MNNRESNHYFNRNKATLTTTISYSIAIIFSLFLVTGLPISYNYSDNQFPTAEARCPNGYHKSPSGDCEPVLHHGGLPRCPNGSHRSPSGDCERVSDGSSNKDTGKDTTTPHDGSSGSTNSPIDGATAHPSANTAAESTPGKCDKSLWDHVYNPSRLQIVDNCITITGTIDSIRAEKDGDLHIRLSVDSQYSHLVNQANKENQFGDLVLEPICVREVTQPSAIAACENFRQNIDIPHVGAHVKVTGSYVLDHEHSDWAEIHPITSIEATPS